MWLCLPPSQLRRWWAFLTEWKTFHGRCTLDWFCGIGEAVNWWSQGSGPGDKSSNNCFQYLTMGNLLMFKHIKRGAWAGENWFGNLLFYFKRTQPNKWKYMENCLKMLIYFALRDGISFYFVMPYGNKFINFHETKLYFQIFEAQNKFLKFLEIDSSTEQPRVVVFPEYSFFHYRISSQSQ